MNNPFDLTGKVALITGGNGGLGLAMAHGLAQAGAAIAIVARDEDKTARAVASLRERHEVPCEGIRADVGQPEAAQAAIERAVESLGRLDILINNAGTTARGAPEQLDISDYEQVMRVNLTAALHLSQLAHPHQKAAGGGKIINVGSMTSIFGSGFSLPYAVSKGGLIQLTKSLAIAWAPDNIQVNALLPGWFETELTAGTREHVPELHERVCRRTPAGRWGQPADLAGAAVFLASAASDFVSGASLAIDGGFSIAF